jgi:translation initiation factor IF-2
VVIESRIEQGQGAVATVLVQRGTLEIGDIFVAGSESGRVRVLINDQGENITKAGPSVPAEVVGFAGAPGAGDEFFVVESEARAREVAEFRSNKNRGAKSIAGKRGSLEEMFESIKAGEIKELPVVIKADAQGSVEAIIGMFENLPQDEVQVQVLHKGVGGINESDITLAGASSAAVFGFNVRANPQARDLARQDGVDIRYYSVIYDVIDDIKKLLVGMMAPIVRETFLGNAEVRDVFNVSKIGKVAGCFITAGEVRRGAGVRLLRDDVVIHQGSLSTLKRFKDDVNEVKEAHECGMSFENYNDLKVGDVIECFDIVEEIPEI